MLNEMRDRSSSPATAPTARTAASATMSAGKNQMALTSGESDALKVSMILPRRYAKEVSAPAARRNPTIATTNQNQCGCR